MASQRRAAPPRGRRPRRSPRHMGRGSGSGELVMAVPPGRCPDCPGPERGGGGGGGGGGTGSGSGTPAVPHLGIAVDEGDVLPGALRLMRELRPGWEPARVKTKVRPTGGGRGEPAWTPRGDLPKGVRSPAWGAIGSSREGGWGLVPGCYRACPGVVSSSLLGGSKVHVRVTVGPALGGYRTCQGGYDVPSPHPRFSALGT